MADCEYLQECPFFNGHMAIAMPEIVENMKQAYCLGDNSECARYLIAKALGKDKVGEIAPNQTSLAKNIIASYTVKA